MKPYGFGLLVALTIATFYAGNGLGFFYTATCHPGQHSDDGCHLLEIIIGACFLIACLGGVLLGIFIERCAKFFCKRTAFEGQNPFSAITWFIAAPVILLCTGSYLDIHYTFLCTLPYHDNSCDVLHNIKQFCGTAGICISGSAAAYFFRALQKVRR